MRLHDQIKFQGSSKSLDPAYLILIQMVVLDSDVNRPGRPRSGRKALARHPLGRKQSES